ncbi:PxKF domain-containing protein [Microbulbifer sp. Q7]|uniref:PxKF domain-containing protein n=1 Tax=Microbulbifer sp. Q7 TaxID=1785091 RepID=UPI00082ED5DE|nr:PxKF domain-containing protein [Microbulbifer sp. Q7]
MDRVANYRVVPKTFLWLLFLLLSLVSSVSWASCGGVNERACCFFERLPSCDSGLIEVAAGEYPGACDFIFGPLPAGTCVKPTNCGGAGERGCCNGAGEFSDVSGVCDSRSLAPLDGCVGDNCWCSAFGAFFGGKSQHTCAQERSTGCGGEGQRACCVIEGGLPCESGLIQQIDGWADKFIAVSGDATCTDGITAQRSIGTCVKASPGNIPSEPATGWAPPGVKSSSVMRGYLDMHLHLLADTAHGGNVFVGEPAPRDANGNFTLNQTYNINTALSPDGDLAIHEHSDHGLGRDTIGDGTQDGTRSQYGAPYFSGWPKWTSTTHQQAYYVWLERAWRGGLRAVSMLAVTNEALCKSTNDTGRWAACENSMKPIIEQLLAAKKFEAFIDDLADGVINGNGVGEGWFRIVTTPEQARQVISSGKLAVMLGIEVDNLFNCKESGCPADFGLPAEATGLETPATLEEAVQVIYDLGVRHVFPVHNFDNAFGAAATWQDAIGVGQAVVEQRWWSVENCGVGKGDYGFKLNTSVGALLNLLGFGGAAPGLPTYPAQTVAEAMCNARGLQLGTDGQLGKGAELMRLLMEKGILIDIDHMSNKSIDNMIGLSRTFSPTTGEAYPLIASHVQFFDLFPRVYGGKGRHERMRTRAQLEAIRDSGGMIAAMLKDDVQDTDSYGDSFNLAYRTPEHGSVIHNNCRYSSKTWGQALQYAVDVMGAPVAMGSDFNGIAGHLGPRFGSDACGGWEADNGQERARQEVDRNAVQYPFELEGFGVFERQQTGFKRYDYNVDGLAHIGLLPDLIADLRQVGLDAHYEDQLFCSAEAFVRVWERAEAISRGEPDPARELLCKKEDAIPPLVTADVSPAAEPSGWHSSKPVQVTLRATDEGSGLAAIDYLVREPVRLDGSTAAAEVAVALDAEGVNRLEFSARDLAGNRSATTRLPISIDTVAPQIAGESLPDANEFGWNNTEVAVRFYCDDVDPDTGIAGSGVPVADCGPDQLLASLPAGSDGVTVRGDARDLAGNTDTMEVGPIRIDREPPSIVGAVQPPANSAGWHNAAVQVLFTCTDSLSGVQSCSAPVLLDQEGANQSASGAARDRADNDASTTLSPIAIDTTPPDVAVTVISMGDIYTLGSVPSHGCTTSDSLSGVAREAIPVVSGGTSNGVGRFTAACNDGLDLADNLSEAAVTFDVHYAFSGFLEPIDALPVSNQVKAGQVVPVKFGLAGDHGLDILLGGQLFSTAANCSSGVQVNTLEDAAYTAGSSTLKYSPGSDTYQYNWKTEKSWSGSCRVLLLKLDDGTVRRALFSFK